MSLANLTAEERELTLDVGQFTLDMIGIVEPTPFADLTSAIVSMTRGHWGSAAISSIAVIPYLGDTAKLLRISSYARTLERAVIVARGSPRFAAILQPILARLLPLISRIPIAHVSADARNAVLRADRVIRDFLPQNLWALSRLDQATETMLKAVFGDPRGVGFLQRQNMRVVVDFLQRNRYAGEDTAEWAKKIKGIDLHSSDAVVVRELRAGDEVAMYVDLMKPANREIGEWMTQVRGAVSHRNLGVSGHGRERGIFRAKTSREVLVSRAAPVKDVWTTLRRDYAGTRSAASAADQRVKAEFTAGGGEQIFLPRAWEVLERVR